MARTLSQQDQLRLGDIERRLNELRDRFSTFSSVDRIPSARRFRVQMTAHGFSDGQWVYPDDYSSGLTSITWQLAGVQSAINAPGNALLPNQEPLGMVTWAANANAFDIVFQGWVRKPTLGLKDWTLYIIDPTTPGGIKPFYGVDASFYGNVGTAGAFHTYAGNHRVACWSCSNGWLYIPGPVERSGHTHSFAELAEVASGAGAIAGAGAAWPGSGTTHAWTDYSIVAYVQADKCWEVIDGARIKLIAAQQTGPMVLGVAGAGPAYIAAINASVDGQVLARVSGSIQWTTMGGGLLPAPALEALSDVSISISPSDTRVTNDFLTWNGSAWVNRNLGKLICIPAAGAIQQQLAFDGGAGSGVSTACGIAKTGSRLVVANTSTAIDFIQSGSIGAGTDVCLRWKNNGTTMEWRDQAAGDASTGTAGAKVAEWFGDPSATNRYFGWRIEERWYDQTTVDGGGTHYLRMNSTAGAQKWSITDDLSQSYMTFRSVDTRLSSTQTVDFNGNVVLNTNTLYFGTPTATTNARITGTNTTITLNAGGASGNSINITSGTNSGVYVDNLNPTLLYIQRGNVIYFGDNTSVPKTTNCQIFGQTASVASNAYQLRLQASATGLGCFINLSDLTPTGGAVSISFGGGDSTVAGSTLDMSFYGVTFKKTSGGVQQAGFFGVTAVGQQTTSSVTQTSTAPGATYNQSVETAMFNDITSLITAYNGLRTALRNLGFSA